MASSSHDWETGAFHSWETGPNAFVEQHWDDDDVWGHPDSDSDLDDDPPPSPFAELLTLMVTLLYGNVTFSARHFCLIFYWMGKCGISEAVKWGKAPGAQSGKYNEHVQRILGTRVDREKLYDFEIPA